MTLHNSTSIIRLHGSCERYPVKLTMFFSIYLISTAVLYNNFFGLQFSSRWPLLVGMFFFSPLALLSRIRLSFKSSLALFIFCFFLLEILHMGLGSFEATAIASLVSILVFLVLVSRLSKEQCFRALEVSCIFYILLIYPLAFVHGMVGNVFSGKGGFVSQYIPNLNMFLINGNFQSGRGVIGMVGGVIAIFAISRIRQSSLRVTHLALLFIGIFAILVSDSRGPMLSFFVVLVLLFLPIRDSAKIRLLFIFPISVVLLQCLLLPLGFEFIVDLDIFSRQDTKISDVTRDIAWNQSFHLAFSSLLHGVLGGGAIGSIDELQRIFGQNFADIEEINSAHNLLLQISLDGGMVLLLIFVFYLIKVAAYGLKYAEHMSFLDADAPALFSFILLYGTSGSVVSVDRVNEIMSIFIMAWVMLDKQIYYGEHRFRSKFLRPVVIEGISSAA